MGAKFQNKDNFSDLEHVIFISELVIMKFGGTRFL